MSRTLDKILGADRQPVATSDEPGEFRSFVHSGDRPQMGFSVALANGETHGFFFHNLDNLLLQTRNGVDYLSFTSRGKAVTMQGSKLGVVFRAIIKHTVVEIIEADGGLVEQGQPSVVGVEISMIGANGTTSPVRLAK